jgi:hypothetical protein
VVESYARCWRGETYRGSFNCVQDKLFDCATRDETASCSAQDDNKNKDRQKYAQQQDLCGWFSGELNLEFYFRLLVLVDDGEAGEFGGSSSLADDGVGEV